MPDGSVDTVHFPTTFFEDPAIEFLVLYFYPGDFTSICATELLAFHDQLAAFHELGCGIVACSVNSAYVHGAWKRTPKQAGGLGTDINHPMLADVNQDLSVLFDVLIPKRNAATRGMFILNRNGQVIVEMRSDTKTARNVHEVLRVVQEIRKISVSGNSKRERTESAVVVV